jgi:uncharacterized protein (DUF885 family)
MKLVYLLIINLLFMSCAEKKIYTKEEIKAESEKANDFFNKTFDESVDRSPMYQTFLGMKKDNDKWDDQTDENAKKELEITKKNLAELKATINRNALNEQTKVSYDLFATKADNEIEGFKFRFHDYPVNQMFGLQSQVPSFLINFHRIDSIEDAKAYISRLSNVEMLFDQLIENLKIREEKGIIAPKFVFPYVISDSKNVMNGSTILDDFNKKVMGLSDLSQSDKDALINDANEAMKNSVKPAYQKLISYVTELETKSDTIAGIWKVQDGEVFYNNALKKTTTTNLTADEIFNIGKSEVERIHGEMREIMKQVDFKGNLQEFFEFMRTDKQFYYKDNELDRKKYMDEATELINIMKTKLDDLFITKPKADMIVKRVEEFREKSAGKAFYNRPSADGTRPGIYYANLYKMSDMPIYQMEALAYHEGIPGHHMQLALAQELEGIPKFRKYGSYTAYTEGWGLYSEFLPKEYGFYEDPYSDFGRLAMELWRACRLVVDAGIHYKKWTREQGIEYYSENTPNPIGDAIKMVERHIVMPSQATAYKIGMMKILELREKAKKELADKFDIREFHEVVLASGPLPLSVLESYVDEYIKNNK